MRLFCNSNQANRSLSCTIPLGSLEEFSDTEKKTSCSPVSDETMGHYGIYHSPHLHFTLTLTMNRDHVATRISKAEIWYMTDSFTLASWRAPPT